MNKKVTRLFSTLLILAITTPSFAGPRDGGGVPQVTVRMHALADRIDRIKPRVIEKLREIEKTYRSKATSPTVGKPLDPAGIALLDRMFRDGAVYREVADSAFVKTDGERCSGSEDMNFPLADPDDVAYTGYFAAGSDVCWKLRPLALLNVGEDELLQDAIHELSHHFLPADVAPQGSTGVATWRRSEELAQKIQDFVRAEYWGAEADAKRAAHHQAILHARTCLEQARAEDRGLVGMQDLLKVLAGVTTVGAFMTAAKGQPAWLMKALNGTVATGIVVSGVGIGYTMAERSRLDRNVIRPLSVLLEEELGPVPPKTGEH